MTAAPPPPDARDAFVLDPRGAAFFPEAGVLAVADLHLGYEAARNAAGAALPRHELATLAPLLDALLDAHRPDVVVLDGDVKHAFNRRLPEEARSVAAVWRRLAARARVVVVEGNHDAGLREILPDAEVARAHRAGRLLFAHGHASRGLGARPGDLLVLGHEHPALTLRDGVGAGLRTPAFLHHRAARREVLVLPALGPWAAGVDALRPGAFLSPLLARHDRDAYRALALAGDRVLDFGTVGRLREALGRRSRRGRGKDGGGVPASWEADENGLGGKADTHLGNTTRERDGTAPP